MVQTLGTGHTVVINGSTCITRAEQVDEAFTDERLGNGYGSKHLRSIQCLQGGKLLGADCKERGCPSPLNVVGASA